LGVTKKAKKFSSRLRLAEIASTPLPATVARRDPGLNSAHKDIHNTDFLLLQYQKGSQRPNASIPPKMAIIASDAAPDFFAYIFIRDRSLFVSARCRA
jgi:hypothetical protein